MDAVRGVEVLEKPGRDVKSLLRLDLDVLADCLGIVVGMDVFVIVEYKAHQLVVHRSKGRKRDNKMVVDDSLTARYHACGGRHNSKRQQADHATFQIVEKCFNASP